MFQTMICRALSPGCAEQHHMRGDHCNPFRFIPDFMCLIKLYSEAAWHGVAYDGRVFTRCARCDCFSVGGIWIRNNLPQNSWGWGTAWKPPQGKRHKGHGLKYAAQILPPVELWGLLWGTTGARLAFGILAGWSHTAIHCHCFAQASCEQPDEWMAKSNQAET